LFIFLVSFFFLKLKKKKETFMRQLIGPYLDDSGCQVVSDHFRLPSHSMAVEIYRANEAHMLND